MEYFSLTCNNVNTGEQEGHSVAVDENSGAVLSGQLGQGHESDPT